MKIKPTLALLVIVTGCVSSGPDAPVRYGKSVEVVAYDTTPRPFNHAIEVFTSPADVTAGRSRRAIAQLVKNGWANDEALIHTALIWRAKSLGADGVILLSPASAGYEWNAFSRSGVKKNFKAEAFIWTTNP